VDDVRVRATGRSVELPKAGSIDKDPGKQNDSDRNTKSVFTPIFVLLSLLIAPFRSRPHLH